MMPHNTKNHLIGSNKRPHLSFAVAMDENRVIGKDNRLPWHLPNDLRYFKNLTTGHIVLMGRKTFESIGKPLPNRLNIILSRNSKFAEQVEGCKVVTNIDDAYKIAKEIHADELFVIGGGEIFRLLLPLVNKIYLTLVHHKFQGDTYFPELDDETWQETARTDFEADDKHKYRYSFIVLERVRI